MSAVEICAQIKKFVHTANIGVEICCRIESCLKHLQHPNCHHVLRQHLRYHQHSSKCSHQICLHPLTANETMFPRRFPRSKMNTCKIVRHRRIHHRYQKRPSNQSMINLHRIHSNFACAGIIINRI